jgi:hypothetical protein
LPLAVESSLLASAAFKTGGRTCLPPPAQPSPKGTPKNLPSAVVSNVTAILPDIAAVVTNVAAVGVQVALVMSYVAPLGSRRAVITIS